MTTAHTRVFAILGDPVAHSLSPRIHNAAFAACGLDATYVALRTDADAVAQLMHALARAGGGGSITVPHKQTAAGALDEPGEWVRQTGACNTFWSEHGRLRGENTDVQGFRDAARHHGVSLDGARVLLIGSGGAAVAVLLVLRDAGARVVIVTRSPDRAAAAAQRVGIAATVSRGPPHEQFDVIINATPLGLQQADPFPFPLEHVAPGAALLDLVYAPGDTPWIRAARGHGLRAFDGTEMLVRQAAAAFTLWTGHEAPLDVMRATLPTPAPLP